MSLYGALYTGVSGLSANSRAMATTSTNHRERQHGRLQDDQDRICDDARLHRGARAPRRTAASGPLLCRRLSQQGDVAQTSSSTDLAISGQGFFAVTRHAEQQSERQRTPLHARRRLHERRRPAICATPADYYLQGWALDANGNVPINANDLTLVSLGQVTGTAQPDDHGRIASQSCSPAPRRRRATSPATCSRAPCRRNTKPRSKSTTARVGPLGSAWRSSRAPPIPGNTKSSTTATPPTSSRRKPDCDRHDDVQHRRHDRHARAADRGHDPVRRDIGPGAANHRLQFRHAGPGRWLLAVRHDVDRCTATTVNGTLFGGLTGVRVDTDGYVIALFANGIENRLYKLPVATFLNADGLGAVNGNAYGRQHGIGRRQLQTCRRRRRGRDRQLGPRTIDGRHGQGVFRHDRNSARVQRCVQDHYNCR